MVHDKAMSSLKLCASNPLNFYFILYILELLATWQPTGNTGDHAATTGDLATWRPTVLATNCIVCVRIHVYSCIPVCICAYLSAYLCVSVRIRAYAVRMQCVYGAYLCVLGCVSARI